MNANPSKPKDNWASGDFYEPYVGRWSRRVAPEFLQWLSAPRGGQWLDVGCGTGALSEAILEGAAPSRVQGVDRSEEFISFARAHVRDARVQFDAGDAQALDFPALSFDAVVSGLMLNFVPQPERAVSEMARVTRIGGIVALYVWDYASKMQFMRHFWNAAAALDPKARELDEGRRFPLCKPEALSQLFHAAGLREVQVHGVEVATDFRDFEDFWSPFLGGQGSAPSYVATLKEDQRSELRERLRLGLPFAVDGSIPLVARAWAVRGLR